MWPNQDHELFSARRQYERCELERMDMLLFNLNMTVMADPPSGPPIGTLVVRKLAEISASYFGRRA